MKIQNGKTAEEIEELFTNSLKIVDKQLSEIEKIAQNDKVVAIGEIGLDYHWNKLNKDLQKKVKEMSDLLKQSNYYLDISRRENKKIKDKYNALINNFNTMKNMDNSQVQFNSASFEEMKKNNNDISISNPTMSKNFINNST